MARPSFRVYATKRNKDKEYRCAIGIAYLQDDGSIDVLLNAHPVNDRLSLIPFEGIQEAFDWSETPNP